MGKRIIPIIITVIGVVYLFIWGCIPAVGIDSEPVALLFMVIAALLICVLIANLIKRLRELKEEDEDDISNY